VFVFHKLANAQGHHFRANRWTAELLGRCDGGKTAREIVAELGQQAERPTEEVEQAVVGALRRLHRERLVIFVEPRRSADPTLSSPAHAGA
jgi:hypothetical protein